MTRNDMDSEDIQMLHDIIAKRVPTMIDLEKVLGTPQCTNETIDLIQGILGDEFAATGIENDSEPNGRGILIDELIDKVGHFRIEQEQEPPTKKVRPSGMRSLWNLLGKKRQE